MQCLLWGSRGGLRLSRGAPPSYYLLPAHVSDPHCGLNAPHLLPLSFTGVPTNLSTLDPVSASASWRTQVNTGCVPVLEGWPGSRAKTSRRQPGGDPQGAAFQAEGTAGAKDKVGGGGRASVAAAGAGRREGRCGASRPVQTLREAQEGFEKQ